MTQCTRDPKEKISQQNETASTSSSCLYFFTVLSGRTSEWVSLFLRRHNVSLDLFELIWIINGGLIKLRMLSTTLYCYMHHQKQINKGRRKLLERWYQWRKKMEESMEIWVMGSEGHSFHWPHERHRTLNPTHKHVISKTYTGSSGPPADRITNSTSETFFLPLL
jgi:hypothetical protein